MIDSLPTKAEAARIAGKSTDQLSGYVKGKNEPAFTPLANLAAATGYSLDWLATGEGPKRRKSASEPIPFDADRMRLASKIAAVLERDGSLPPGYDQYSYATALYEVMMTLPPADK